MHNLSVDDFGPYLQAVHGQVPFPWQMRLLKQVHCDKRWPSRLGLPTGVGKTAAIDVAIFNLALSMDGRAALPPRRIVFVVDRRTIVDQAFVRAETIQAKLADSKHPVVQEVARRLISCGGKDVPLHTALECTQLRGGIPQDTHWVRRPDQPAVIVSTVDQVGSRILFRGYGCSPSMRPVHAGLLANDCLILVDEPQISQPFVSTMRQVAQYRRLCPSSPSAWQVTCMSATLPPGEDDSTPDPPFSLNHEDHENERLRPRLVARKPAICEAPVKVAGNESGRCHLFAKGLAAKAVELARPATTVGVIVNRVRTASAVADVLSAQPAARVIVLTGRMRPLDRDERAHEAERWAGANRAVSANGATIFVVATQCIEVGADYDFDALVSECAPLDSLRQRAGRVNRLGRKNEPSPVHIMVRSDSLGSKAHDPIYAAALKHTWQWLEQEKRDFGTTSLQVPTGAELQALLCQTTAEAPVMLPTHLDLWTQTRPATLTDPDVALWLHGAPQQIRPEVRVVWREDVNKEMMEALAEAQETIKEAAGEADLVREAEAQVVAYSAVVSCCPPVGVEALSVPLSAVQAWLMEEKPDDDTVDVEGVSEQKAEYQRATKAGKRKRRCLVWSNERCEVKWGDELYPDAVVIVPAAYGGIHPVHHVWDPLSNASVEDCGDEARFRQTGRPVLRLTAQRLLSLELPELPKLTNDETEDSVEIYTRWQKLAAKCLKPQWLELAWPALCIDAKPKPSILRIAPPQESGTHYLVALARAKVAHDREEKFSWHISTADDDDASHTGVKGVLLEDHLRGVAAFAKTFSKGCHLPDSVAHDVVLAARWHDLGKVDHRFQMMLRGNGRLPTRPLAKSGIFATDRATRQAAQARSGYPRGMRHEIASVALLAGSPLLAHANDPDLVLHLIASHHGWARPFAPVIIDSSPVQLRYVCGETDLQVSSRHQLERLDSGIAERFWLCTRRYGWWELARFESILRLADHCRSQVEQIEILNQGDAHANA